MIAYIWPPTTQQGLPCSLSISIPQLSGTQTFSELSVVLEDEALGCPVLDVQFPIAQPASTQSVKVIIDPRETGAGHIKLRLAGWETLEREGRGPPQCPVVLKLPLICLPAEAADEVAALFDKLVKARLADYQQQRTRHSEDEQQQQQQQQEQQPGAASSLNVDEQHLVVAQVHQEHINPICKDLATILRDPAAPYHRLKHACDRLIPKLVSYGMSNCHNVVRGWLALMEDEETEQQGPSMVNFLSEARIEGTGQTLEQAIGTECTSSCNSGSLTAFYIDDPESINLSEPKSVWNELLDSPQPHLPSPFISVQRQHSCLPQQTLASGTSSSNEDFVLTSFLPEQDQGNQPHLLTDIQPHDSASVASYTDDDEETRSWSPQPALRRADGTPRVHGLPMLPSCPASPYLACHPQPPSPQQQLDSGTQPAPAQPRPSPSPAVQLRSSPLSVLLSGFKGGSCEGGKGPAGACVPVEEREECCNSYEHRFVRCWAVRHQGLDTGALVLTLALLLGLLPWGLMAEEQQQRRTRLGLLLLQAVPTLLSGIMLAKPQGMEKHRDRITVLARAVSAAVLAGLCMAPEGQPMPALLLRAAHTPLLLRAAIVVFHNAYRVVLLRNAMLVSLGECLALGWVSVCAGTALGPSLAHALSLWGVAVLTSAMLDASSRRSFGQASLHGLNPGAVFADELPSKGSLGTHVNAVCAIDRKSGLKSAAAGADEHGLVHGGAGFPPTGSAWGMLGSCCRRRMSTST